MYVGAAQLPLCMNGIAIGDWRHACVATLPPAQQCTPHNNCSVAAGCVCGPCQLLVQVHARCEPPAAGKNVEMGESLTTPSDGF